MATPRLYGQGTLPLPRTFSAVNQVLAEHLVVMGASALFHGFTHRELTELASGSTLRTFKRGEILFLQGQSVRNLILLQSGIVKHTQLSSDGSEVLLWMSSAGDPVNLQAESVSCSHTCSARAIEPCQAMVWEHGRLQILLAKYPAIRDNTRKILAARLRELEERFREVATEKVPARLAFTLLRLMKCIGKPTSEGIRISLSREELAQMTGTTLFTISRIISKWAERGFVIPQRESVLIADAKRLELAGNEAY